MNSYIALILPYTAFAVPMGVLLMSGEVQKSLIVGAVKG